MKTLAAGFSLPPKGFSLSFLRFHYTPPSPANQPHASLLTRTASSQSTAPHHPITNSPHKKRHSHPPISTRLTSHSTRSLPHLHTSPHIHPCTTTTSSHPCRHTPWPRSIIPFHSTITTTFHRPNWTMSCTTTPSRPSSHKLPNIRTPHQGC